MDSVILICQVIFWSMLAFILYPYTLYPLLLWVLTRLRPRGWQTGPTTPKLSVIIAAYNEQSILREKLANTFSLDYPTEALEIVVASDCSSDDTDTIAKSYAPRVKLARLATRSGKQIALNNAVQTATGEILLFTDASVLLRSDAARNLARNFSDPQVGAVSSVIHIRKTNTGPTIEKSREAEGAYLDFDLSIRRLESLAGSAVGCCGSCYAVRRSAFVDFAPSACNDFVSALDAVRLGFRVVMDDEAVGYMLPAKSVAGEFRRKARTIAGGLETYWRSGRFAGLSRPTFFWQLLSHKVCRWLGPVALLIAAVAALVGGALGDPVLLVAAVAGLLWVAAALVVIAIPELGRRVFPLKLANFAFVAWLAGIWAWVLFLRGKQQVVWQPTQR